VARECCVWGSSVRDMLLCAVRFLGQALDFVYWWVISSKNEGVGTGDVCGSKFVVSKTEDWLGCPLLVDGSVCVGGGHLIKLFVMGCLWCVAERGCGGGVL